MNLTANVKEIGQWYMLNQARIEEVIRQALIVQDRANQEHAVETEELRQTIRNFQMGVYDHVELPSKINEAVRIVGDKLTYVPTKE